jgi:hypothetical protein
MIILDIGFYICEDEKINVQIKFVFTQSYG